MSADEERPRFTIRSRRPRQIRPPFRQGRGRRGPCRDSHDHRTCAQRLVRAATGFGRVGEREAGCGEATVSKLVERRKTDGEVWIALATLLPLQSRENGVGARDIEREQPPS
jgi:hypothetical protein